MESGALAIGKALEADVAGESRVKRLVLCYIAASTAFLFVSGLLGMLLRESQADFVRLDPAVFYAIMTAHGLGAFVAWGAFAVMGASFRVLAEVGLQMRQAGVLMAWTACRTMVIGIVVTTLVLGFGASWVFLYPLPFSGSGDWDDTATGLFAASLAVSAAIIAVSAIVLHESGAGEQPSKPALGASGGATTAAPPRQLFVDSCGSCHALSAAGTEGKVGPNLDDLKPDATSVLRAIENGGAGGGAMPKDILLGKDAEADADYVARSVGP